MESVVIEDNPAGIPTEVTKYVQLNSLRGTGESAGRFGYIVIG